MQLIHVAYRVSWIVLGELTERACLTRRRVHDSDLLSYVLHVSRPVAVVVVVVVVVVAL